MSSREEQSTSFGREAGAYDRSRPGYPVAAVEWLLAGTTGAIVDVGAGTGKLTAALPRDRELIAVEPDAGMLEVLTAAQPHVRALAGTGERLPLSDASAGAVLYAQAWHWVDVEAASQEAARVLAPGGVLGLIWNIRDHAVPWIAELTDAMGGSDAEQLLAADGVRVAEPFGALERASWEWSRQTDVDGVLELARSRSLVITATADDRERILADVRRIAEKAAVGGIVEIPYRTTAFRASVG